MLPERPQVFSFQQRLHTGPLPAHTWAPLWGKEPLWADRPLRQGTRHRACAGLQGLDILTHCPTCNWQGPVTSPVTLRLAEQLLFLHAAAHPVPIASRPTPPQAGSGHPLQPLSSSALSGTEQHQCWVSTKGQEDGEEHHS